MTTPRLSGMLGFSLVWLGQMVSLVATNMTSFALTIWVYPETGSATALGLMTVFYITPFLLISPVAGVMVDRYDRKLMMMLSDLGSGVATLGLMAAGVGLAGYVFQAVRNAEDLLPDHEAAAVAAPG